MEKTLFLQIHPRDNVAVALADLEAGFAAGATVLKEPVKRGHKFAIADIAQGEMVIKYGAPIGHATEDIGAGEWVHTHNLKTIVQYSLQTGRRNIRRAHENHSHAVFLQTLS